MIRKRANKTLESLHSLAKKTTDKIESPQLGTTHMHDMNVLSENA